MWAGRGPVQARSRHYIFKLPQSPKRENERRLFSRSGKAL
jgi:hypothetical protein